MDIIQEWSHLIFQQVTPSRLQTVHTTIASGRYYFLTLLDSLTQTSPSLTTIALLLIIILLSLKLLDMLWRAVVFWIQLATRIIFWGFIVAFGCWVWIRGPEGVIEDASVFIGTWKGELHDHQKNAEYRRLLYQQKTPGARAKREGRW